MNILKNIKIQGVKESDNLSDKFLQYIEEIKKKGYTFIPNIIATNDLDCIRNKIDNVYKTQFKDNGGRRRI